MTLLRILAVLCLPALGCDIAAPAGGPIELMPGIYSRQSPDDVADLLRGRGLEWVVVEADEVPARESVPRFSLLKWQADGFLHEDIVGQVHLTFYNDQLLGVWFYPNDESDREKIEDAIGMNPGTSVERQGVKIRIARDYRGKWYISYEDAALLSEKDAWIARHA